MNTKVKDESHLYIWGLLTVSIVFGYATYKCFIEIYDFFIPYLVVRYMEPSWLTVLFSFVFSGCAFLGCWGLAKSKYSKKYGLFVYKKIFIALSPLFGLIGTFFIVPSFATQIIYTVLVSISIFRLLLLYPSAWCLKEISQKWAWGILIFLTTGFVLHGYFIQVLAFETLNFPFLDWAEYLLMAQNTAQGEWFMVKTEIPFNFLGSHFSPSSILLIALWFKFFSTIKAFFLMNSLALYINVPLAFCLARIKKLPVTAALILSVCTLLSPSLVNLNLTTFNGFHPIIFMMPTLLLFFILLEKKLIIPALLVFLFSLTIKESVAVFWVGMGCALFFSGRRKLGAGISIGAVAYYLIVMNFILPSIAGDANYDYIFRYQNLGNSQLDILIAPFVRPKAFWGNLFRPQSFYFISMLFLPTFLLAFKRCLIAFGAFVSLMFICLLTSNQVQNICTQYQSEGVIVVFIAAILGAGALYSSRTSGKYFQLLSHGVLVNKALCARRVLMAALPAVLVSSVLSWYFFGENYYFGRAMIINHLKSSNKVDFIEEFNRKIPLGASLTVTRKIGSQFLLRNEASWSFLKPYEYVLIDLFETDPVVTNIDEIRGKLLGSNNYQVLYNRIGSQSHYMLFGPVKGKKNDLSANTGLKPFPKSKWDKVLGKGSRFLDDHFEVKTNLINKNDVRYAEVAIRVLKKIDVDIDVKVNIADKQVFQSIKRCFANGLKPAFLCKNGDVFFMQIRIPDVMQKVIDIDVDLIPRRNQSNVLPSNL